MYSKDTRFPELSIDNAQAHATAASTVPAQLISPGIRACSTMYLLVWTAPVAESDGSSDGGIADALDFTKQWDTSRIGPAAPRSFQY